MVKNPVLLIALPLIIGFFTAFISPFIKKGYSIIAIFTAAITTILSSLLFSNSGTDLITYPIGGWSTKYGIYLISNIQISGLLVLVNFIAFLALIYYSIKERDLGSELGYSLGFILSIAAVNGLILTGDLFNMFVFIELLSIGGYILATHKGGYYSAFKYVVLSSIGGLFFLIGVISIYNVTGLLSLLYIPKTESFHNLPAIFLIVLSVIWVIGLSGESELFPLNMWVGSVYKNTSTSAVVFFASVLSVGGIYAIIKLLSLIFNNGYAAIYRYIYALGLITLFIGEAVAFKQKDAKKMLGYSSIAQAGLIISLVALSIKSSLNIDLYSSAIFQLINNIIAKALVLFGLGVIGYSGFNKLKGVGKERREVALLLTIGTLSLAGMPGFAGFWSKFYIVKSLVSNGEIVFLVVFLFSALFEVYYLLRLSQIILFEPQEEEVSLEIPSIVEYVILTMLAAVILYIGFYPNVIYNLICKVGLIGG